MEHRTSYQNHDPSRPCKQAGSAAYSQEQAKISQKCKQQGSSTFLSANYYQWEGRVLGPQKIDNKHNELQLQYNEEPFDGALFLFTLLIHSIETMLGKCFLNTSRPQINSKNSKTLGIYIGSSIFRLTIFSILISSSLAAGGGAPQCAYGQVWDSSNNNCAQCLDSYCKQCSVPLSINVCQTCDDGYVLYGSTCRVCSAPYCQSCAVDMQNVIICATCVTGYTLGNAGCQLCSDSVPHCADCTSPTNCLSCQAGFIIGVACDPCQNFIAGCTQCSDASTCTECNTLGYFLEPGQTSCSLCSSKPSLSFCSECEHTGLYCITCNTNYMLGGILQDTCDQCGNVVPNCATCTNNACTGCNSGHMLSAGNCQPCNAVVTDCLSCTSTDCTNCSTGYFIDSKVCSSCAATISNCTSCSNSSTCDSCIADNLVVFNGSAAFCQHCSFVMMGCQSCVSTSQCNSCDYSIGYFLNSSGVCDLCSPSLPFCALCTNSSTCTLCSPSYGFNNQSQCQSCPTLISGCGTCLNYTYCTSCSSIQSYFNFTDSTCHTCISYLPQCLQCFQVGSSVRCSKCNLGFHVNYNLECVCDAGTLIGSYCVDIVGCVQASFGPVCTACQSGMILINDNCVCPSGYWLVSGHCTNVIGCIAVKQATPINICLFCDIQKHFVLGNDSQCHCSQYFKTEGSYCLQICGDGVAIDAECDDGNRADGDGCSSSCRAETGYTCSKASQTSKCIYSSKFTITLVKIEKIQNANSGRFVFEFSPNANALSVMNYSKYLNLSIPNSNYTITSITYSNGYLDIGFDYSSDLMGLTATLTLDFDPSFFSVDSYSYSFPIVSDGLQLRYHVKLQFCKVLQYVFMGLGLLSLAIFVVSLPLHKMMGVETLQTFQVFFVTALIIDSYEEPLNVLAHLKHTIGMVDIWAYNASVALNTKLLYNRLGVLRQFFQNQILVCPLSIVLATIFLPYFLKYLFYSRQQPAQTNIFLKKLVRACSRVYRMSLFPIVIGFSFGSLISLYSQAEFNKQWNSPHIKDQDMLPIRKNFFFVFMSFLLYSFLFWAEVLIPQRSQASKALLNVKGSKSWYVSYYLAYSLLLACVFMGGYQFSSKSAINLTFIVILAHLCIILLFRPYQEGVHLAGIIVNQLSLLSLYLILLVRSIRIEEAHFFTQEDNIMIVLLLAFLLALVDLTAIIRIVAVAQYKLRRQPRGRIAVEQSNCQQMMLQTHRGQAQQQIKGNRYLVGNQIMSVLQTQWRESQMRRVIYGVEQFQFNRNKLEKHLLRIKLRK